MVIAGRFLVRLVACCQIGTLFCCLTAVAWGRAQLGGRSIPAGESSGVWGGNQTRLSDSTSCLPFSPLREPSKPSCDLMFSGALQHPSTRFCVVAKLSSCLVAVIILQRMRLLYWSMYGLVSRCMSMEQAWEEWLHRSGKDPDLHKHPDSESCFLVKHRNS